MLKNHLTYRKSFEKLVKENKQELLNDKQVLEKIEKRIEKRHELTKPV
ncbi:hypothetical protein QFZ28_003159 [Neobacillus niacini]|nr:FbpB family small basic protein [Neobacillus niacini]MDQ1002759.1 hypothetical protein [Neobacillus niacini]